MLPCQNDALSCQSHDMLQPAQQPMARKPLDVEDQTLSLLEGGVWNETTSRSETCTANTPKMKGKFMMDLVDYQQGKHATVVKENRFAKL